MVIPIRRKGKAGRKKRSPLWGAYENGYRGVFVLAAKGVADVGDESYEEKQGKQGRMKEIKFKGE